MGFFGDIFGGFMVMLFILGFFLALVWFIIPFVIFAMKGKLDSAYQLLEDIDRRLAALEKERPASGPSGPPAGDPGEGGDGPPL